MIFRAAGRLGLSVEQLDRLTWRELDDMDFGRRLMLEDLAADLKSFAAACQGVTLQPDTLNPIRSAAKSRSSVKLKPSQVRPDGHVTR